MKNLLFIGLGRMGFPMAGHLAKNKNFSVSVYNRTPSKTEQWLKQYSGTAHHENNQYDTVILCVGNDASSGRAICAVSKVRRRGD